MESGVGVSLLKQCGFFFGGSGSAPVGNERASERASDIDDDIHMLYTRLACTPAVNYISPLTFCDGLAFRHHRTCLFSS